MKKLRHYWLVVILFGGSLSSINGAIIGIGQPIIVDGVITEIKVISGGACHASSPMVTITDDGGGAGAAATALLDDGEVTSVRVTSGGSNYTPNTRVYFIPHHDVYTHAIYLGSIDPQFMPSGSELQIQLTVSNCDGGIVEENFEYSCRVNSGSVSCEINGSKLVVHSAENWTGTANITVQTIPDDLAVLGESENFDVVVYSELLASETRQLLETSLASDPQDPVANYQYIFWELADLLDSDKFKSLLNSMGFSSDVFDLTLETIQHESSWEGIDFLINQEFELEQIRAFILEEVLPTLDSLEDRFSTIEQGQVIQLYEESELGNSIYVDYADSLIFRAFVKFLTSLIRIELAYGDHDVSAKQLAEMYYSGIHTTEYIRDKFPALGSAEDSSLLEAASNDLKAAIDFYQDASPLLHSANRTEGLFLLESEDLAGEQELYNQILKLEQTLEGTHPWGDSVADLVFLNLKPFFEGNVDLSVLLPRSYGNQLWDEPLNDPTFGGLFPNITDSQAREFLSEAGLLTDNLWAGITPINRNSNWWDGSQWWQSHWFGMMYRDAPLGHNDFEKRIFPSQWMFHLWLGWIYPAEATPESIWIWQENSESWIWTNKELFPILYSHTSGLWFYVSQEDGSQYIWLNGEWVFFK